MAKRFELIVFDWDGTLMDSTNAIVASLQAAAKDIGVAPPSDEMARHIIGLGLLDAMRLAIPDLHEERYRELGERYRYHYLAQAHELRLFEGIVELMDQIDDAGHNLAVATGKTRKGLDRAFSVSGLGERFRASRCADECHSKPNPQMLEELMDEFGVLPEVTLMIGDTTHDLQMAQNAGVSGIGVAYGAHPREALETCGALYCAENVAELAEWLKANA